MGYTPGLRLLTGAWFFAVLVTVRAWDRPRSTSFQGQRPAAIPRPTKAAILSQNELLRVHGNNVQQRVLGVSTCGYQNGNSALPVVCSAGSVCVTNAPNNVIACCNEDAPMDCEMNTSCVPNSLVDTECTATACQANDFLAICSNPAAPNCISDLYVFGSTTRSWVFCGSRTSTQWTFSNTYLGFTGSPFQISSTNNLVYATTTTSEGGSSSSTPSTSSTSHSRTRKPVHVPTGSNPDNNGNSSTPVGAIAGGTVGGVAVLAICTTIMVWLCLRHRRRMRDESTLLDGGNKEYPRSPLGLEYQYPPSNPYIPRSGASNATETSYTGGPPRYEHSPQLDGSSNTMSTNPQVSSPLAVVTPTSQPIEADGTPVSEVPAKTPVYELPARPKKR